MLAFITFADRLSAAFGKTFAWLILLMTFGVSYEVFVRYVLNSPTPWSLDVSFIMYGTLFMMGGAYTLSRNGHVRGDFLYRLWKPSTQAKVDLVLYFVFFFPGCARADPRRLEVLRREVLELHRGQRQQSRRHPDLPVQDASSRSPASLLFIQGIAQVFRCILCIREGYWREAEDDVQETEELLAEGAGRPPTGAARHGPRAAIRTACFGDAAARATLPTWSSPTRPRLPSRTLPEPCPRRPPETADPTRA